MSSNKSIGESLVEFLSNSAEFYSRLLASVESQLCFKTSELVYDKVQFSSKTQRRKVGCFVVWETGLVGTGAVCCGQTVHVVAMECVCGVTFNLYSVMIMHDNLVSAAWFLAYFLTLSPLETLPQSFPLTIYI